MEHVALQPSVGQIEKIARENCAINARIPALGYRALEDDEESQQAHSLAQAFLHYFSRKFFRFDQSKAEDHMLYRRGP